MAAHTMQQKTVPPEHDPQIQTMTDAEKTAGVNIAQFIQLTFFRSNPTGYIPDNSESILYTHEIIQMHMFALPEQIPGTRTAPITFDGDVFRKLYKSDVSILDITVHISVEKQQYMLAVISNRGGATMPPRFNTNSIKENANRLHNEWATTRNKVRSHAMCCLCICVGRHMDSLLKEMLGIPSTCAQEMYLKPHAEENAMVVFCRIAIEEDSCDEYQISVHLFNMFYAISEHVQKVTFSIVRGDSKHYVAVYVYLDHLNGKERPDWEPKCLGPPDPPPNPPNDQKRKRTHHKEKAEGHRTKRQRF